MKESWEMQRDKFNLAELPDKQLGRLYQDWEFMYEYGIPHLDDETLAAYALLARDVLGRRGSEEASEFARFARIRLACTARGWGLASVESAYKVGKDYLDFHYLIVQRALANGYPVPPEVLADYIDLTPKSPTANQAKVLPAAPLLADGKPRAPLPDALVAKLKPRHELIYQVPPDNPRHPFYSDGSLIIYGNSRPVDSSWPDYWIARWLSSPPDTMPSILLWEGKMNLDIVRADTPRACADVLCAHLAAWGHTVEIVLADNPQLSDGRPRAPLPLTLYQRLRATHALQFHPDAEHPCYHDDVLTLMGARYLLNEWNWVMHYLDAESGPLPIDLWRDENGLRLIGASTPEGCLAEFQAHLAAWGRPVQVALETPAALDAKPSDEPRRRPGAGRKSRQKKEHQLVLI